MQPQAMQIRKKKNSGILEFAGEMYEGNKRKKGNKTENEHGSDENGNHYMQSENESVGHKKQEDPNQALLQYFVKLSSYSDDDDSLDLKHIQSLLQQGASVNTSDRFGQTLLHEVSRTWGVDVAQFFIEPGRYI